MTKQHDKHMHASEDPGTDATGESAETEDIGFPEENRSPDAPPQADAPAHIDAPAQAADEIHNLKDQLLRKVAEFENFRRRTTDEKSDLIRFANEGLIHELLTVVDDFDRSLKAGREHPDFDSFYKGIELVRGNLMKLLERRGVTPIVTAGRKFDVDFHDALLQLPRNDVEPGSIIDEVAAGYLLHDRVIRHSKVIVASEADGTPETPPS